MPPVEGHLDEARPRHDLLATWLPTLLSAGIALVALAVAATWVYDDFHPSIDQATYAAQADALRHGDLTIPDSGDLPVVFTAPTSEGLLAKYLPGTAAIGATSDALVGGTWLAQGAILVLLVVATAGVAAEAGLGARSRAVAGLLVGLSPCILALDARLLSYVPGVALATAAAWAVLAGGRLDRAAVVAAGGLTLGAALLVRQLEVVAWAVVLVVWLAATAGSRPVALRRVATFLVAVVPGVALVALYDLAVTGSAWKLPYTLVSPEDGPGFGPRRALVTDPFFEFDLLGGLRAAARSPELLVTWIALGPLVAIGAVLALRRPDRPRVVALLVGLVAVIPLVFVVQWSHKNALRGGHYDTIGPFYLVFTVPPLVVLGVVGWRWVARRRPSWLAATVVVVVAVQVALLWAPLQRQVELDRAWASFGAELAALGDDGAALVLVEEDQRGAQFPELRAGEGAVTASVPNAEAAFAVLDRWPDHQAWLATREIERIGGRLLPVPRLVPVEALTVPSGADAQLDLTATTGCPASASGSGAETAAEAGTGATAAGGQLVVLLSGQPAGAVACGAGDGVRLLVGVDAIELRTGPTQGARAMLPDGPSTVAVCATTGPVEPQTACRRLAVRRTAGGTQVLLPGLLDADAAVQGVGDLLGAFRLAPEAR
jgi:hypothetical protein